MKKLITFAALLFTLLPLSAQAGWFSKEEWESEDCPKEHSLAWCLADYQGRSEGIHDMSQEDFVAALKKAGVDESHIGDILHDSLGVGLSMTNFAFGNLFGGSMFLMSALMPSYAEQNAREPYMIFLESNHLERTRFEVSNDFRSMINNAVMKSFETLPKTSSISQIENGIQKIEMPNSNCPGKLDCVVGFKNDDSLLRVEKREILPSYLGSKMFFSSGKGQTAGVVMLRLPKEINRANLAKAISENLPSWVYWYIPTGYFGKNPFPMMLNQGKALFFVKPKEGDAIPILPHVGTQEKVPAAISTSGIHQTSEVAN